MTQVIITLTNGNTNYDLKFNMQSIPIAQQWIKHVQLFIDAGLPWDDDRRFYNLPGDNRSHSDIADHLRHLVSIIKNYNPNWVTRDLGRSLSQDDLNYLHHVFEVYHGLYDQQHNNKFYKTAPAEVQTALADLNIWIHRYESLGATPRFVATWKCKPYRDQLLEQDYKHFTLQEEWGDLRINYCEIGKTLYDFWNDNDQYILPEAFVPQQHYCFDFTVRFTPHPPSHFTEIENQVWQYYDTKSDFFESLGYHKYDPRLSLGGITVGKLDLSAGKEYIYDMISKHQCLKDIKIIHN